MARNDNLTPLNQRDPEEARAIRAAGGRAAAKAKARNNKLKARLEYMLSQKTDHTFTVVQSDYMTGHKDIVSTDGSYYDWMISRLVSKACNGDMKAIGKILDILGEDSNENND